MDSVGTNVRLVAATGRTATRKRGPVLYESTAEPIRLGYLMDFKLPEGYPQDARDDLFNPFELVFRQGLEQGLIDRPVEVVFREVEGLPKGTIKAVIDAYGELVEEGCLASRTPPACGPTGQASSSG